ncbi:TPA: hypothetical protein DEP21_02225 [Patescibacteria group bacterium]|nr:hypothetical protein [Candidatus Gracilibacteria bacterium]
MKTTLFLLFLSYFGLSLAQKSKAVEFYSLSNTTNTIMVKEKDIIDVLQDTSMLLFCEKDSTMIMAYLVPNSSKMFLKIKLEDNNSYLYLTYSTRGKSPKETFYLAECHEPLLFKKIKELMVSIPEKELENQEYLALLGPSY